MENRNVLIGLFGSMVSDKMCTMIGYHINTDDTQRQGWTLVAAWETSRQKALDVQKLVSDSPTAIMEKMQKSLGQPKYTPMYIRLTSFGNNQYVLDAMNGVTDGYYSNYQNMNMTPTNAGILSCGSKKIADLVMQNTRVVVTTKVIHKYAIPDLFESTRSQADILGQILKELQAVQKK